jgi:hypothetical protein
MQNNFGIAAKSPLSRSIIAVQSFSSRSAIALQSLYNCCAFSFKSIRIVIASHWLLQKRMELLWQCQFIIYFNFSRAVSISSQAAVLKEYGKFGSGQVLVSKTQGHKHQLGSLAVRAAQTELANLDKPSNRGKSKAETQGKYGW